MKKVTLINSIRNIFFKFNYNPTIQLYMYKTLLNTNNKMKLQVKNQKMTNQTVRKKNMLFNSKEQRHYLNNHYGNLEVNKCKFNNQLHNNLMSNFINDNKSLKKALMKVWTVLRKKVRKVMRVRTRKLKLFRMHIYKNLILFKIYKLLHK